MKYIIYLFDDTSGKPNWADGCSTGDPSRTLVKTSAKVFETEQSAQRFLNKLKKHNLHRDFSNSKIVDLEN